MEHRHQIRVECPACRWGRFQEVYLDLPLETSPLAEEIKAHLEKWLVSHCPDHLWPIVERAKN